MGGRKRSRVLVGHADVDSGKLMVGDPCYFWPHRGLCSEDGAAVAGPRPASAHLALPHWSDVCDRLSALDRDGGVALEHAHGGGLCCVVRTTYGDGSYPVYLETSAGGRRRLVVDLD